MYATNGRNVKPGSIAFTSRTGQLRRRLPACGRIQRGSREPSSLGVLQSASGHTWPPQPCTRRDHPRRFRPSPVANARFRRPAHRRRHRSDHRVHQDQLGTPKRGHTKTKSPARIKLDLDGLQPRNLRTKDSVVMVVTLIWWERGDAYVDGLERDGLLWLDDDDLVLDNGPRCVHLGDTKPRHQALPNNANAARAVGATLRERRDRPRGLRGAEAATQPALAPANPWAESFYAFPARAWRLGNRRHGSWFWPPSKAPDLEELRLHQRGQQRARFPRPLRRPVEQPSLPTGSERMPSVRGPKADRAWCRNPKGASTGLTNVCRKGRFPKQRPPRRQRVRGTRIRRCCCTDVVRRPA